MITARHLKVTIWAVTLVPSLFFLFQRAPVNLTPCDPNRIVTMLDVKPQPALTWVARFLAFLTTPFKRLGMKGWTETGCRGEGTGRPVRDAQHSSDGFFTIDVFLTDLQIDQFRSIPTGRYIRLEVEPGTDAHMTCTNRIVGVGERIHFEGPILVDRDGPFLEIHPKTIEIEGIKP